MASVRQSFTLVKAATVLLYDGAGGVGPLSQCGVHGDSNLRLHVRQDVAVIVES